MSTISLKYFKVNSVEMFRYLSYKISMKSFVSLSGLKASVTLAWQEQIALLIRLSAKASFKPERATQKHFTSEQKHLKFIHYLANSKTQPGKQVNYYLKGFCSTIKTWK